MKTLVISDIHANIVALEAVWKQEAWADLIICAGDLVDYGPSPRECIEWMMDKDVRAVFGNHDLGVIQAYEHCEPDAPVTWRIDNARKLAVRHIEYLKSLPEQICLELDGSLYGVTHTYHGYTNMSAMETFHEFSGERFGRSVDNMIFGHTHRRGLHYLSDTNYWLNPGSVSYRRVDESYRGAHYAVIQDGTVSLRSVPYPVGQLYMDVAASAVCQQAKDATERFWSPLPDLDSDGNPARPNVPEVNQVQSNPTDAILKVECPADLD